MRHPKCQESQICLSVDSASTSSHHTQESATTVTRFIVFHVWTHRDSGDVPFSSAEAPSQHLRFIEQSRRSLSWWCWSAPGVEQSKSTRRCLSIFKSAISWLMTTEQIEWRFCSKLETQFKGARDSSVERSQLSQTAFMSSKKIPKSVQVSTEEQVTW